MKRGWVGVPTVLSVFAVCACSTLSLPKPGDIRLPAFQFRMRDFQLPSGMRIIFQEDHRSPHVAIVAVVGTGAANDFAGREGLAHFVEHLAFRGEPVRGMSAWHTFEKLGVAELNAFTSHDVTVYYEVLHRRTLERALEIEARRLLHPLEGVRPEVFAVEREVVRNELRQRGEMELTGEVVQAVNAMLFDPSHPYSRPVVGTHESLTEISLEDARAFTDKYYRPENITLFVAGDVDLATTDALIARLPAEMIGDPSHAKPIARRVPAVRTDPPDPPQPREHRLQASDASISRSEAWIAWTIPGDSGEKSAIESALMVQTLAAAAWRTYDPEHGILGLSVGSRPGVQASTVFARIEMRDDADPERCVEHVLNQLIRVDVGDRAKTEVRLRWRMLAAQAFGAEDMLGRSLQTAWLAHQTGSPALYGAFFNAMVQTPAIEVGRLANQYLSRERARILYVTPVKATNGLTRPPGLAGLGTRVGDTSTSTIVWTDVPSVVELASQAIAPPKSFRLENGLEVIIDGGPPALSVLVELSMFGGSGTEARAGEEHVSRRLLRQHEHRNGDPFDHAAGVFSHHDRDRETRSIQAAAGNLVNALAMLAETAETQEVTTDRWRWFEITARPEMRRDEELPSRRAQRAFASALFGPNGYGHLPSADELAALERSNLEERSKRIYQPSNAVLVVVGAEDATAAERDVRAWFSGWSGRGERVPPPPRAPPHAKGVRYVITDHPGATQAGVSLGCVFDKADARRDASYDVLARIVDRGLWSALRQRMGVTYGTGTSAERLRSGNEVLETHGSIEVTRIREALAAIERRWSRWSSGQVSEKQIDGARWAIARRRAWQLRSSFARAASLARSATLDGSTDAADHYPAFLQAVAKPTIDRALAECHDGLVVSLEGPIDTLRAAVPAAWTPITP